MASVVSLLAGENVLLQAVQQHVRPELRLRGCITDCYRIIDINMELARKDEERIEFCYALRTPESSCYHLRNFGAALRQSNGADATSVAITLRQVKQYRQQHYPWPLLTPRLSRGRCGPGGEAAELKECGSIGLDCLGKLLRTITPLC